MAEDFQVDGSLSSGGEPSSSRSSDMLYFPPRRGAPAGLPTGPPPPEPGLVRRTGAGAGHSRRFCLEAQQPFDLAHPAFPSKSDSAAPPDATSGPKPGFLGKFGSAPLRPPPPGWPGAP